MIPTDVAPEISGDTELDARLTPVSTYTIANGLPVQYTLVPEEAGTIVPANDGKTIDITWNQTYKGEVTLTATPMSECSSIEGNMTITVRNSTNVNEIANNAKLYPNPTSEKFNIECMGMIHVSVFSTIGQMVYDADVNADQLSIDMSQFPAGSYLVRIVTSNGICTKHLSLTK